jgi:hypothetical protein
VEINGDDIPFKFKNEIEFQVQNVDRVSKLQENRKDIPNRPCKQKEPYHFGGTGTCCRI